MLGKKLNSMACTIGAAGLLSIAHMPAAQGDSAYCISRVSSYVRELDDLLAQDLLLQEKHSIMPFVELNNRYFPFVDCDPDPLLVEASRSRFFRSISYSPRAREYLVRFASKNVDVRFVYSVDERRSNTPSAGWVDDSL